MKSVVCYGQTTFCGTEFCPVNVKLIHVTSQLFNVASLYSHTSLMLCSRDRRRKCCQCVWSSSTGL